MPSSKSRWNQVRIGRIELTWSANPTAWASALHPAERALLERLTLTAERRAEWIAGRVALARLPPAGAFTLVHFDGAPRIRGARWVASISHDRGWVAAAAR